MNPKPLWLTCHSDKITFGFRTLRDAGDFVRAQSRNLHWIAAWTFQIQELYGEEVVTATAPTPINLRFDEMAMQ